MTEKKFTLLTTSGVEGSVEINPEDPKTWYLAGTANRGNRLTISAQGPDHVMALSGIAPRKFHTDPVAHMAAEAAVSAYYGLDGLMLGEDVYDIEAEALGQKMVYGESMPTIDFREPFIAQKSDLDKLKAPDSWIDRGRVKYMFEIQKTLVELGAQSAYFCAPFSLAVGLRSYPKLIRDIRRDPEFAHAFMGCLVDEILPSYLKELMAYCGAGMATGADAWAAYPDIGPDIMEEWVLPYNARLTANCQKLGFMAMGAGTADYCEEDLNRYSKEILHKCFDIQSKNMFGTSFVFMAMGRWHEYPLEDVVEYLAEKYESKGIRATVQGAINARFMREASPQEIVDYVKRLIDLFGRKHDLALFIASTPADTPSANVHAAVAAARTYGQLPIAENLDEVPFELPQRETFEEYVNRMSNGKGLPV